VSASNHKNLTRPLNLKNNNCSKWIEDQNIRVEVGSATNEIRNRPVSKVNGKRIQANDLLMVTKIDDAAKNFGVFKTTRYSFQKKHHFVL